MATVAMRCDANTGVPGKDVFEGFMFYRAPREGESSETRFAPVAARLKFASKEADTLELSGMPPGFLVKGDVVRVTRKKISFYNNGQGGVAKSVSTGSTVFRGDVEKVVKAEGRGSDETESVICAGPWAKMARLVYRKRIVTGNGNGGATIATTSRVILNQYIGSSWDDDDNGQSQSLKSELVEIAGHGATACGYTSSANLVDVPDNRYLPFDECRDITVADAIKRELRFFPKVVTRFDYTQNPPRLEIERMPAYGETPSGRGSWDRTSRTSEKSERRITRTAHPITGVDLEIETVGSGWRNISHQRAGDYSASNVDCLYATLQLAGAEGSTVTQSFKSVTEAIPSSLNDKSWWMSKHPRLRNVAASAITITDGARSGTTELDVFTRISAASAGDLEAAGLRCRVEEFTCSCTIDTGDDVEEGLLLSCSFLTTNAQGTAANPRKYTWVVSSESQAGESAPEGLAAAILADRSGAVAAVDVREYLRIASSSWPQIGMWMDVDGERLYLQRFEVDCATCLAELHFGTPEHLAPEDMAALLSGFRNKRRPSTAWSRKSGRPQDDNKSEVCLGGIMPLSSTEFCPGVKQKAVVDASGTGAGKIILDGTAVPSGKAVGVHSLKVNNIEVAKILATEDVNITVSGGGATSTQTVITGVTFGAASGKIVATLAKKTLTVLGNVAAADETTDVTTTEEVTVVAGSTYNDNNSHAFENTIKALTVLSVGTESTAEVFTSTPHSAESGAGGN